MLPRIEGTMNKFAKDAEKSSLFSIAAGEAALDETIKFYSNVYKSGNDARQNVLNECIDNPTCFERPIEKKSTILETEYNLRNLL